jgi:hypothetical protein
MHTPVLDFTDPALHVVQVVVVAEAVHPAAQFEHT